MERIHVPSLEEIIACWGPALVEYELPAPLVDACGSGSPVEPVTSYINQGTDPISELFKPTDIFLADPMGYPMPEMGCSTLNSFELYGPIGPLDRVSNPSEFTVQCIELKGTTLQNYEPELPPAFPISSPRKGVDNVITHCDSATEQRSCPSDKNIDPEVCRQAKCRFVSLLRPETAQSFTEPNDEASQASSVKEVLSLGQR